MACDFSYAQSSDENLLLHLTFDNNLNDISGYNHTITKYGTSFVADRNGNPDAAIFFDGTDDYIDIANHAALNFGFSDFTISFWLKYPSQLGGNSPSAPGRIFDYATIFIKAANPVYPYEGITFFVDHKKHGDINFRTSNPHDLNITTNLNNNTWHFYVLRRQGQELSVFIDGALAGRGIYPIDDTSNSAGIRLGANHVDVLSQNYEGAMDDLKIYDRALDDNELIVNPVQIIGSDFLCSGNSLTLQAVDDFDTYTWSTNDTTQFINIDKGGIYWVRATKRNITSVDSIFITEENCDVKIIGSDFLCSGNEIILTATDGFDSYSWNTDEITQSISIDKGGIYWIHATKGPMTAVDSIHVAERNCKVTTVDNSLCHPLSLILEGPEGYDSYLWNTGERDSRIAITQMGWYMLEANYNDHKIKDSVFIDSELCFNGIIPNVITPNGDSFNEFFEIPVSLSGARLIIYNRWGRQVFFSPSYRNNWNAEGNNPGIYHYILELKEFDFTYKGWIHVFK